MSMLSMRTGAIALLGLLCPALGQEFTCNTYCGKGIQYQGEIVCYCHAMCVLEASCCDDFAASCPSLYAEGQAMLEEDDTQMPTLPAMPDGCDLPESNVIPVPSDTFKWDEIGRTCDGHCGSLMVDDSDGVVCFCDSSCLLTADCCADFLDTCDVDPCILALVMPAAPEGDPVQAFQTGSCMGSCGSIVQSAGPRGHCSCEGSCVEDNSCCGDFQTVCPSWFQPELVPSVPVIQDGSCFSKCGAGAGTCWCDYQCIETGDCCEDYADMCGVFTGLMRATGFGSCHGHCGGSGFDCWCDETCEHAGDCCSDYLPKCKSV